MLTEIIPLYMILIWRCLTSWISGEIHWNNGFILISVSGGERCDSVVNNDILKHLASWIRLPEVGDSQPPFLKTKKKSERDSIALASFDSGVSDKQLYWICYFSSVKLTSSVAENGASIHALHVWKLTLKRITFERNNPSWTCLGP